METENTNTIGLFVKHIFLFSGGLFWGLLLLLGFILSNYQIGIKKADSEFETVINQVNSEVAMNHMYKDQEASSKGRR